jgi:subtilisin family serine protease
MQRRHVISGSIFLGLVGVASLTHYTGMIAGSSGVGAATGAGPSGCAGMEGGADVPVGEFTVIDDLGEMIGGPDDPQATWVPGRFVIRLADGARNLGIDDDGHFIADSPAVQEAFRKAEAAAGSRIQDRLGDKFRAGMDLGLEGAWTFESDREVDEILDIFFALDEVLWVEPVHAIHALGIPNDPLWPSQWHMSTLNLNTAWDRSDGSDIVVAVIDTGVRGGGPDGLGNLLAGHDFVDGDADANDEHHHGTHVAGTIAQATNNGVGAVGVAPGASILPVRVLDASGAGTSDDVASGIVWAVDHGADIINLSLGSSSHSSVIEEACEYAAELGVLVVAAAGNKGHNNFIGYPAALDSTMAVGATDLNHDLAPYSNRGDRLTIVAPGGNLQADADGDGQPDGILQEGFAGADWGQHLLHGTSMATAHVAGLAALLKAHGVVDRGDIWRAIIASADDLGDAGWDRSFGHGLINPLAALDHADAAPEEDTAVLEIERHSTRALAANRVSLNWATSLPADTWVEGDNGFAASNPQARRRHKVILRGEPGTTVDFIFRSATEAGQHIEQLLSVDFDGGGE